MFGAKIHSSRFRCAESFASYGKSKKYVVFTNSMRSLIVVGFGGKPSTVRKIEFWLAVCHILCLQPNLLLISHIYKRIITNASLLTTLGIYNNPSHIYKQQNMECLVFLPNSGSDFRTPSGIRTAYIKMSSPTLHSLVRIELRKVGQNCKKSAIYMNSCIFQLLIIVDHNWLYTIQGVTKSETSL